MMVTEFDKASKPASDKSLARSMGCFIGDETKDYDAARLERYAKRRTAAIRDRVPVVEVCADHYYAADASGGIPKNADIQILVSCGHFRRLPPKKLFVKEGGLFIMSNGEKPSAYIGRLEGGVMVDKYHSESETGLMIVEF